MIIWREKIVKRRDTSIPFSKTLAQLLKNKKLAAQILEEAKKPMMEEGQKVKLNYEKITQHPNYQRKVDAYKKFVEMHKDQVLTVEYDPRHNNNPSIVCFAEDASDPKWFVEVDALVPVKREGVNDGSL